MNQETEQSTAYHQAPDLSIVIISWNVRVLLAQCLNSIKVSLADSALSYEITVVDAQSQDHSAEMVAERFPHVRLIALDENVGFTRGNNIGLAHSHGRYMLLINPDTKVIGDALTQMISYMDAHPDVGVLGPKLRNPDGTVQSSRRRFPTLATALIESPVLQEWFPDHPALKKYHVLDQPDDQEQQVDWVKGACFLVRRTAYEQVGPMDEAFFMYSEELDWIYRIRQAGWQVVYLPQAEIIHYGEQSSGQVKAAQHVYFQSSKVYFYRKHRGVLVGELLRWFLLANYAYQWLIEGAKWLLGHKRPLRASRLDAYGRVIRSRLAKAGRGL